jgi:hypothetical protein
LTRKLIIVAALVVVLTAVAAFGAGWKWEHPPKGALAAAHVA